MTLAASLEWSILQFIGAKAKRSWHARAKTRQHLDNNFTFLEINLRQIHVLLVKIARKTLPLSTFNELQKDLQRLCHHLNNFVNPSLIARNVPNKGDGESPDDTYSNLRELLKLIDNLDVDLVVGPPDRTALFLVPANMVAEVLGVIEACNTTLMTLFHDQHDGYFRPHSSPHAESPLSTTFGDRAGAVLGALLQHYTACEFSHELLLALPEKLDAVGQNTPDPILDILLSDCSRGNQYHEAQCLPYWTPQQQLSNLTSRSDGLGTLYQLYEMPDLCGELRKRQRENTLVLFFEQNTLFSGRERHGVPSPSRFDTTSLQSFDNLIKTGAFRTPTLKDGQTPVKTLNSNQKNVLALKLAHCLAQFFLHTKPVRPVWDSKRIYLVRPPNSAGDYLGPLYMPFTRLGRTVRPSRPLVWIGEPTLLAFSKLLLEIKSGEEIDLSHIPEPIVQWAKLCEHQYLLEREGGGLYAQAIRGALYLGQFIRPEPEEDPVLALQHAMQDQILSHLEAAAHPP